MGRSFCCVSVTFSGFLLQAEPIPKRRYDCRDEDGISSDDVSEAQNRATHRLTTTNNPEPIDLKYYNLKSRHNEVQECKATEMTMIVRDTDISFFSRLTSDQTQKRLASLRTQLLPNTPLTSPPLRKLDVSVNEHLERGTLPSQVIQKRLKIV